MKHLGDITKISGYDAPVVDCIVGGSPCQDLSVAGNRAGLDGERSGLYMEQVRIVKEMREKDERTGRTDADVRPRYMVWENVPGAFSSNKGEDFRIVLEELAKVADKNATIPRPPDGKWTSCGCILGDGWSIAWRVLDAQFWGTSDKPLPQRRRRIALVADFGGQSAPEILFVRESVSGNIEPSESKRKATTSDAEGSVGADDRLGADQYNAVILGDTVSTLGVNCGMSHGRQCVLEPMATAYGIQGNMVGRADKNGPQGKGINEDVSFTLNTIDRHSVCYAIGAFHSNAWKSDNPHSGVYEADKAKTLDALNCGYPACNQGGIAVVAALATGEHSIVYRQGSYADYVEGECGKLKAAGGDLGGGSENLIVQKPNYIVRRLTPLECERLQGYPDGWTDIGEWVDSNGKKRQTSDAARYKALGNSIALPPWKWVLKRLCACYERDATMASLFDGIGGFPYLWEQLNGKGSCLWASEIEEFPIAVTKVRIG